MIRSVQPNSVVEHLHGGGGGRPGEPSYCGQHPVQHQQGEVRPVRARFLEQDELSIAAEGESFPPWRVHLGQAPPPVGGWVVHLFIKVEMNRKCVWTTSPVRSLLTPSEPPIT